MKKRLLAIVLISALSLFLASGLILAEEPIRIFINGDLIEPDVPPQVINGRTMVPLRSVAEALDCDVVWNEEFRKIAIDKKFKTTPPEITGPADFVETIQGALDLIKEKDSSLYYWIVSKVDRIEIESSDIYIAFASTDTRNKKNIISFSTYYYDTAKANNTKQELVLIHVAILTHETNHLYLGMTNILSTANTEAVCNLTALRAVKSVAGTNNKVYKSFVDRFNESLDLE